MENYIKLARKMASRDDINTLVDVEKPAIKLPPHYEIMDKLRTGVDLESIKRKINRFGDGEKKELLRFLKKQQGGRLKSMGGDWKELKERVDQVIAWLDQ